MPVFEQSYRHYEGGLRHKFRWWIVVEQEFRVLAKSRVFKGLVLLAGLHYIVRVLQVVGYDVIVQDPNHPMAALLSQVEGLVVNARTFFDFVRLQSPLMFITLLYAGSGMICNDFRNNLMEIFFSKPLRWYDYVFGKALALILLGLALTALPALLLLLQHALLLPRAEVLQNAVAWGGASFAFSLVVVLPTALGILACSALLPGQNYAAITVFMLIIANSAMSTLLAGALRDRNYFILSLPMAVNRAGQYFFGDNRLLFDLNWLYSLAYVLIVCAASMLVIMHRVRRAEVAS